MSPILRRYQQRYPKTCQHKIHNNLRFGEEEAATSRTFLKKDYVKTNIYHTLDPKHSPPLLINRNQAKLISMFAPSFPILLSAPPPPNTPCAINYNSNSKLFRITLVFIIIVPAINPGPVIVFPFHSLTHSLTSAVETCSFVSKILQYAWCLYLLS